MISKLLIKNSKHIVWGKINSAGAIVDANKAMLKLLNIRKFPSEKSIGHYFTNFNINNIQLIKAQNIIVRDNILYKDIVLYFSKKDDFFEFIGELPSLNNNDIVTTLSILNQDFMVLSNEVNKKNKQLEKMLETIRETQSQLIQKEKMAGLGKIAAGIAHEINNPLGSITSNVEYLEKSIEKVLKKYYERYNVGDNPDIDWIKEDMPELIEDLNNELTRIKDIIQVFREYSDIDRINDLYPYDINQGINNVLELTKHTYEDSIQIKKELNNIPSIIAKGSEINQVISQLISNAILSFEKRESHDNTLIIKTNSLNKGINVTIKDNGKGISDEILNRIYEPFFTTRDVGEGQGLGLTICYDIITRIYKGTIKIDSKVEEGTTVDFWLPCNEEGLT